MGILRSLLGIRSASQSSRDAQRDAPRVLYKYLPIDRCCHWLEERTAAFVAIELLNDPYEGTILSLPYTGAGAPNIWEDRPVMKYRVGNMVDVGVNPSYDPTARSRRLEEQVRQNRVIAARRDQAVSAIKSCRILSLAASPDRMVMWAHYASNSQGLCIGIDWGKAGLIAAAPSESHGPFKPVALAVEYVDHPFESRFETSDDYVTRALGRKHIDWAYQREVRLLRHASDFSRYAPALGDKVGLVPLPPESIVDIVLGANPHSSVRSMVREQFKHLPSATVRRLYINSGGYGSRVHEVKQVADLV